MSYYLNPVNYISFSYSDYNPEEHWGIVDATIKVLATATIVAPLVIGINEIVYGREFYSLEAEICDSGSVIDRVCLVVATLGLAPLVIGISELWSSYPSSYLEHNPVGKKVDLEKLSDRQLDIFISNSEVVISLSVEQIKYLCDNKVFYIEYILKNISEEQLQEYVNLFGENLTPSFQEKFLIGRISEDTPKKTLELLGKVCRFQELLENKIYFQYLISIHDRRTLDVIKSRVVSKQISIEEAFHIIPKEEREEYIRFYCKERNVSSLSLGVLELMFDKEVDESCRKVLFPNLTCQQVDTLFNHKKELLTDFLTDADLCRLIPDEKHEMVEFLDSLSDEQIQSMSYNLLRKAWLAVSKDPEKLNKVKLETLNRFLMMVGMEFAFLKYLSKERLVQLDLSELEYCCGLRGFEGLIYLMLGNDPRVEKDYSHILKSPYERAFETQSIFAFSDEQIYQLVWRMVPREFRTEFIKRLLDSTSGSRKESLKALFDSNVFSRI